MLTLSLLLLEVPLLPSLLRSDQPLPVSRRGCFLLFNFVFASPNPLGSFSGNSTVISLANGALSTATVALADATAFGASILGDVTSFGGSALAQATAVGGSAYSNVVSNVNSLENQASKGVNSAVGKVVSPCLSTLFIFFALRGDKFSRVS